MTTSAASFRQARAAEAAAFDTGALDHEPWMRFAACAGMGPDLFFPAGERADEALEEIDRAKAVCSICRVRVQCLRYALNTRQQAGIWGGMTTMERRQLYRQL
ncbi:MAG: WhiB family transcriptional regulator [Acidimicrobiales bacterium]